MFVLASVVINSEINLETNAKHLLEKNRFSNESYFLEKFRKDCVSLRRENLCIEAQAVLSDIKLLYVA